MERERCHGLFCVQCSSTEMQIRRRRKGNTLGAAAAIPASSLHLQLLEDSWEGNDILFSHMYLFSNCLAQFPPHTVLFAQGQSIL